MSRTKNLVYGLIFLILLVLLWISRARHNPTQPKPPHFSVSPASVSHIIIKRAKTTVHLQKIGSSGGWKAVEYDYPASPRFVDALFEAFADIKAQGPVSDNPRKHGEYAVDKTGLELELKDDQGKSLLHLIVGKMGPAYTGNFFRLHGKKEVYLTDANLQYPLNQPEYRDLEIFNPSFGELKSLELFLKDSSGNLILERSKDGYRFIAPRPLMIKDEEGEAVMERIIQVRVNDFVDDGGPDKYYLTPAAYHFTLIFEAGEKQGLSVGERGEGSQLYAVMDGSRQVVLVSRMLIESLVSDLKRYSRPPEPSTEIPLKNPLFN